MEKIAGIRQRPPYRRQKGAATSPVFQNQAIPIGPHFPKKIGFRIALKRFGWREDGYFNFKPSTLHTAERWEAVVGKRGGVSIVSDIDDQGVMGLQNPDAAAKLTPDGERDKGGTLFPQVFRVVAGVDRQVMLVIQTAVDRASGPLQHPQLLLLGVVAVFLRGVVS